MVKKYFQNHKYSFILERLLGVILILVFIMMVLGKFCCCKAHKSMVNTGKIYLFLNDQKGMLLLTIGFHFRTDFVIETCSLLS